MKVLLMAFAVPLHNKKKFENNKDTPLNNGDKNPPEGDLTPSFIYGKDENISINKIHLDLIRKRVLEYLGNKNSSEIQKLMVIEKYMNDYEEKITTTSLDKGGLMKDWDFEL
jgi:hypothetical protein